MTNKYYVCTFNPGFKTTAFHTPVENNLRGIEGGLDMLPAPATSGKGFSEAIKVGTPPTEANAEYAPTIAYLEAYVAERIALALAGATEAQMPLITALRHARGRLAFYASLT